MLFVGRIVLINENKPRYIHHCTTINHHTLSFVLGSFCHLNLYDSFSLLEYQSLDSIWKYFFLKARSWSTETRLCHREYHTDSLVTYLWPGPLFLTACYTCGPSLSLLRESDRIPWAKYVSVVPGIVWNVVSHVDCSSGTADVPTNHWRNCQLRHNLESKTVLLTGTCEYWA